MSQIRWDELSEARQLARLGKSLSRAARTRLQWMLFYLFNGRNAARTCRHFGISRQTFYRWRRRFDRHDLTTLEGRSHRPRRVRQPSWTPALAERVLALRKQYPCWGKDKLTVLLAREKLFVSVSMVGRILSALKRRGALHEPPQPAVLLRQHRKLRKRPWAVRKPKYWPIEHPGDLVEIDTKEIRMDGGSEFAAEFELACQQKQLPLFVLPPKSPKLNAHVERSHRTHHEEFYQVHADSDQPLRLNHQLRHWEHTYNCVRPHQSLAYLTPLEFVTRWKLLRRKAKCH